MTKSEMDVKPLEKVMKRLREPGGCPWDREQNHKTLRNDFLEEVYEFLETVDDNDIEGMREELGDVLLQVVFHARLEEELGHFTMQDVVDDIVKKLIHRHPHVYGTIEVDSAEQVLSNWEKIKAQEKTERKKVLDGITKGQPALMRAYKMQKKTAKVGFDWDKTEQVWEKVQEELGELQEAVKSKNQENIEWELGDTIFALANYARHLGVEPEVALNKTNNRFARRFDFVEKSVTSTGRAWGDFSLLDLDKLWNDAKKQEKK